MIPVPRPSHNENDYRVTIFHCLAYSTILSLLGRGGGGGEGGWVSRARYED